MRVALISETHNRSMGYVQNHLPRYMGRLGVEMHLVVLDLPPYFNVPKYRALYAEMTKGDGLSAGLIESDDGFTLHVLGHRMILGSPYPVGLVGKLREIRPDIVQTVHISGWIPLICALFKPFLGFKLFTANHMPLLAIQLSDAGVKPWSWARLHRLIRRSWLGRLVTLFSEACYGANQDCAEIATQYYGVPRRKQKVSELGVDSDVFYSRRNDLPDVTERAFRESLGVRDDEILCIYTGRFYVEKNPLLLAQAVAQLRSMGEPFKGLFVGAGAQGEQILSCAGCIIRPFVPNKELGIYYRSADVGVWPAGQSMSVLDAAACGLPVIVSDSTLAKERYDGNGLTYREGDIESLIRCLVFVKDEGVRRKLGCEGARKMAALFSWREIARRRLVDYEAAIAAK